jgi:hypothetical protein
MRMCSKKRRLPEKGEAPVQMKINITEAVERINQIRRQPDSRSMWHATAIDTQYPNMGAMTGSQRIWEAVPPGRCGGIVSLTGGVGGVFADRLKINGCVVPRCSHTLGDDLSQWGLLNWTGRWKAPENWR